jgi:predicted ATPase
MHFKIRHEVVELPVFVNKGNLNSETNYCALIGPNGTYKSEILATLAVHFGKLEPEPYIQVVNANESLDIKKFDKVVACSTSPYCKFPVTKSVLSKLKRARKEKKSEQFEYYSYIGSKTTSLYTLNFQEKLYDLLLRATVAGLNQDRLPLIQKAFELLSLRKEIHFKFRLKFDLEDLNNLIQKKTSAREYRSIVEFIKSDSFNKFFRGDLKKDKGAVFQLSFSNNSTLTKEVSDFYYNMEILRKIRLVDLLGVTIVPEYQHGLYPDYYDLKDASSGRNSLIQTLLGLASTVEDNSLILIDEPELGLHPTLQMKFVSFLDELLKKFNNINVVIATHSPHILSSLPSARSKVLGLQIDSQGALLKKEIKQSTYGWSTEDILFDVFGIATTRNINVQDQFIVLAEMISGVEEFDRVVFQNAFRNLKGLELPKNDSVLALLKEAEIFLETEHGA